MREFRKNGSSFYDNVDPLPVNERIASLDVVHGFALLGMLVATCQLSTSFFAEADGSGTWPSLLDKSAAMVHDMLFAGRSAAVRPDLRHQLYHPASTTARTRARSAIVTAPAGCLRSWHSV